MEYIGYYINLANRVERNENVQAQLKQFGLADKYKRFEAVVGAESPLASKTKLPPGHLGCLLSHQAIWQDALNKNSHVHILEDDVVINGLMPVLLNTIQLNDNSWDLLFTDIFFHPPPEFPQFEMLRRIKKDYAKNRQITMHNLSHMNITGSTSYLINKASLPKLLDLFKDTWKYNDSFDTLFSGFFREQKLRALVTLPLITTVETDKEGFASSTDDEETPLSKYLYALRKGMYYAADLDALYNAIRPCNCCEEKDPLLAIYLQLLHTIFIGDPKLAEQ